MDPRSAFLDNLHNVLVLPLSGDLAECSHENTLGDAATACHLDNPDPVQRDRTESVSDASQCVSVVGGVVRDLSFSANSSVSTPSSPSLDDESPNHTCVPPSSSNTTAQESANGSMLGQLTSPVPSSPRILHAGPIVQAVAPIHLPNGQYMCPRCPRKFPGLAKASRHVQTYRHAYTCPVSGCRWSYQSPKDLRRHSETHRPDATRYSCSRDDCRTHRDGITFSRRDLLDRHVRNFHP